MKRLSVPAALLCSVLAGCSTAHPGAGVPSLSGGSTAGPGASASGQARPRVGYSASRVAQLHAAARCLREHGVPSYQDPVLTADGHVYTDARSIGDFGAKRSRSQQDAMVNGLIRACGRLFAVAGLQPADESPAPPALVQAGVRAAECLREHGLPSMRDPNPDSPFTPGHGFGLSDNELPNNGALGKQDPTFQQALSACRPVLDAEIRASSLTSLAHG